MNHLTAGYVSNPAIIRCNLCLFLVFRVHADQTTQMMAGAFRETLALRQQTDKRIAALLNELQSASTHLAMPWRRKSSQRISRRS